MMDLTTTPDGFTVLWSSDLPQDANFTSTISANQSQPPGSFSAGFMRNFIIGVLGIVENALAILALTLSKNIKWPLKMYLCGLVANDMIFMTSCTLWMWDFISPNLRCTLMAYGILSPLIVSYALTSMISIHNYVAVFYAVKFQSMVTTKRVIATVVLTWIFGWSFALMCISSVTKNEGPCIPFLVLPKYILVLTAIVNAVTSFGILILNFRVVYFLKLRHRVAPVIANMGPSHAGDTIVDTQASHPSPAASQVSSNRVNRTTTNGTQKDEFQTDLHESMTSLDDVTITQPEANQAQAAKRTVVFQGLDTESTTDTNLGTHSRPIIVTSNNLSVDSCLHDLARSPSYDQQKFVTLAPPQQLVTGLRSVSQTSLRSCENVGEHSRSLQPREPTLGEANTVRHPVRNGRSRAKKGSDVSDRQKIQRKQASSRQKRLKKISITLSIITLWNCCLNMPFFVYMIVSVSRDTGRVELHKSNFSMVAIGLMMVNSLSNPFLYAWRFVEWGRVLSKICGLFGFDCKIKNNR